MSLHKFWVTTTRKLNKKTEESRTIGFVSVFGWETAIKKAAQKYPGYQNLQLHKMIERRRR